MGGQSGVISTQGNSEEIHSWINSHSRLENPPNFHEKNLGWLGYIGDEILPSYMGIIS